MTAATTKAIQTFFERWAVIPVFQSRVFIVKDKNDSDCPMVPISVIEYNRLSAANNAQDFETTLVEFRNTLRLGKAWQSKT